MTWLIEHWLYFYLLCMLPSVLMLAKAHEACSRAKMPFDYRKAAFILLAAPAFWLVRACIWAMSDTGRRL